MEDDTPYNMSPLSVVRFSLFFLCFILFMTVIECVPTVVAKAVTDAVKIPVVGIGAGPHTTGQVMDGVYIYHGKIIFSKFLCY